ncbi:hypothetical protein C8034_v003824 [Colletotrichum sidae]|uniref:Uncharacterized protein n=1 Tax=Colletotrichum sidae TaxID=1347389 RepID=A0A4R8TA38_9PEZI|nr:hypothetical protein C8034_v003824 [Colletotrichum sidae]
MATKPVSSHVMSTPGIPPGVSTFMTLPLFWGPETCGYFQSRVASIKTPAPPEPWACPARRPKCTTVGSFMGCSDVVYTECIPSPRTPEKPQTQRLAGQLQCVSLGSRSECFTYLTVADSKTYTLYDCRESPGSTTFIEFPERTISASTTAPLPSPSTSAVPGGSSVAQPPPTSTSDTGSSGSGPSTGAIAASIAGALAFLGLLAGGTAIFWWIMRKKKKRLEAERPAVRNMNISGPFAVDGMPAAEPARPVRPARSYEMSSFETQRTYGTQWKDGRVSGRSEQAKLLRGGEAGPAQEG